MTEFLLLRIDFPCYLDIATLGRQLFDVGDRVEERYTDRIRGPVKGDLAQDFFDKVGYIWHCLIGREQVGSIRLDHGSPEDFLARFPVDTIRSAGLLDVLTLLSKATEAEPTRNIVPGSSNQSTVVQHPNPRFLAACHKGLIPAALSRLSEHMLLSREDLEAVLALKPTFDCSQSISSAVGMDGTCMRASPALKLVTSPIPTITRCSRSGSHPFGAHRSIPIRMAACSARTMKSPTNGSSA
ncbi:MAG: hypothetical protein AMXMBFR81_14140 [Chthonomonas sp.]